MKTLVELEKNAQEKWNENFLQEADSDWTAIPTNEIMSKWECVFNPDAYQDAYQDANQDAYQDVHQDSNQDAHQARNLKHIRKIKRLTWFGKKVAVIVMGVSCCGKTIMAKTIAKKIKKAVVISQDAVKAELEAKEQQESNDENSPKMAQKLELHSELEQEQELELLQNQIIQAANQGRSLVIEGNYVAPVRRIALITFLRSRGYTNIVLVNMQTTAPSKLDYYKSCATVKEILLQKKNNSISTRPNDELKLSKQEVLSEIHSRMDTPLYKVVYKSYEKRIEKQLEESYYKAQSINGLFDYDVDYIININ